MLPEIKKCADEHDIKGLRYIFVDCLDVDPTFEKYKEDYNYCKGINGFFEDYMELSPLRQEESKWDMQYWERLKVDLIKNFSSKRFEHMIRVARVVYAEKIDRLLKEREKRKKDLELVAGDNGSGVQSARIQPVKVHTESMPKGVSGSKGSVEERLADEYNRHIEKENEDKARREAMRSVNQNGMDSSKKAVGVVLLILGGILVIVVAMKIVACL